MSSISIPDLEKQTPAGDGFYAPPDPMPLGVHGDPIYIRALDNPLVELTGGQNWLVRYLSDDAHGHRVATTGIIALPRPSEHPLPDGGYPLVSWAHGTVGVANRVAPSRDRGDTGASPMNAYPGTLLNHFLSQGWAVAMSDYEALGTGTAEHLHPYLLGTSEAHGVLDIVLAARRLFPDLISDRYAIVGHSQGGQAALFAASHAPARVAGLTAVCAIAPANHLLGLVRVGALFPAADPGHAFTPLFLAGAIGGNRDIDPEQVLAPEVFRDHWPQAWQLSRAELSEPDSWGGIPGNAQFRGDYLNAPNQHQVWFNDQLANMNPDVALTVPVRIAQAADDERIHAAPAFPLKGTDELVKELDSTNPANKVEYERYPKGVVAPDPVLGIHFGTINHDIANLTRWLKPLLEP